MLGDGGNPLKGGEEPSTCVDPLNCGVVEEPVASVCVDPLRGAGSTSAGTDGRNPPEGGAVQVVGSASVKTNPHDGGVECFGGPFEGVQSAATTLLGP